MKLDVWDNDKAALEVRKRYANAADARRNFEVKWRYNERLVYNSTGMNGSNGLSTQVDNLYTIPEIDMGNSNLNVSYLFKNFRFIHAQMSANPPIVVMRPATSDQEDSRRADAADKVSRYALKQYNLQEKVDQVSLNTLLYGTGILKLNWDSTLGDIISHDSKTGKLELEGDISITSPFIWNIFIDPDARSIDKIRYVIEELYIDYEEAVHRWPGNEKQLEAARVQPTSGVGMGLGVTAGYGTPGASSSSEKRYNMVKLLEYWEPGNPSNGYLGRYGITTQTGIVIEPIRANPFRFKEPGAVWELENGKYKDLSAEAKQEKLDKLPERARLPYLFLTDIDVPNSIWGKSFVDYAAPLQDTLSRLDSAVMDSIQAHGIVRLVVPEGSEITQLTNSNWDIVKIAGTFPPFFIHPPQLMSEMNSMRLALIQGINDVCGVNESMFGQQSREQATSAMQYATNQGNMIRRRLFNKYVLFTEALYKSILDLVCKHWTTNRVINVLGKEHALESIDIKGLDVDGGYDVVGDYGVSLSLDPITRQQQLVTMEPLLEKAGVTPRRILKLHKLADIEDLYDDITLADTRQQEIFERIIATEEYVAPKPFRDHTNMIAYALRYFMSAEFERLPEHIQDLCQKHIEDRAQLAAQEASGMANQTQVQPQAPMVPPQI